MIPPTRFSPQALLTHIYICHASHILWENLQAYNNEGTVQQEKEHKKPRTIPSQNFTTYNSQNIFSGMHLTSSKRIGNNMIFLFQKCDTFDQTTMEEPGLVTEKY